MPLACDQGRLLLDSENKWADGWCVYRCHGSTTDQEAANEADRRKDDFLATLAHELRNPLAAAPELP
jgi:signal transduction histidine kinase